MGNSSAVIDYGTWFIAAFISLVCLISIAGIGQYYADAYGVPDYNHLFLVNPNSVNEMNNMTSQLTGTIQSTQTATQSSNINTLGAGVTAWKIFLNLPNIIWNAAVNLFNVLNLTITPNITIGTVLLTIIVVLFFWTLGYFLITGRRNYF
jgi:hypothetical protein